MRWEIELFIYDLMNAFRLEALQLSTVERLDRALALYMVVAWRIARFRLLGRNCPDPNAPLQSERDEWKTF